MRYVVAMLFAIVVAAVFTLKLSNPVSTWVVNQISWESPDGNDAMEALAFMATSFVGLLIGWGLGWMVTRPLSEGQRPE